MHSTSSRATSAVGDQARDEVIVALVEALRVERAQHAKTKMDQQTAASEAVVLRELVITHLRCHQPILYSQRHCGEVSTGELCGRQVERLSNSEMDAQKCRTVAEAQLAESAELQRALRREQKRCAKMEAQLANESGELRRVLRREAAAQKRCVAAEARVANEGGELEHAQHERSAMELQLQNMLRQHEHTEMYKETTTRYLSRYEREIQTLQSDNRSLKQEGAELREIVAVQKLKLNGYLQLKKQSRGIGGSPTAESTAVLNEQDPDSETARAWYPDMVSLCADAVADSRQNRAAGLR